MIRIPGRIPITIYPTFWLIAALIGYFNSLTLIGTLIWIGIIFVSVLIHELGHAVTALGFGLKPRIEFVAMGGLTYHEGEKLPFWKQFLVVLDGPLFGFLLFILATVLLLFPTFTEGTLGATLRTFQMVNLFWTVLNLLPVMPLDGGQLLRIILEGIFGARGLRYALAGSMIVAALFSLAFFIYQAFLIGAIFFLLAYQSYETWRRTRLIKEADRSEGLKALFQKAEEAFHAGQKQAALEGFEKIRSLANSGMLYTLATQYLGFIKAEKGEFNEVYALLAPIRSELADEALSLLQRAAFEMKDFALVVELAGIAYQISPAPSVAIRNASACATLGQVKPALGWLETAQREGAENLIKITEESYFDSIRSDPLFRDFLSSLK